MVRFCVYCFFWAILGSGFAAAQQSENFRVEQHALNAGGVPAEGQVHTSAGYAVTLDSIAGPVGSFAQGFVPAGEVFNLRFSSAETLIWDGHPAAGQFRLYRDPLSALGGSVGACLAPALLAPTAQDGDLPSPGNAFVYLVNVVDNLGDEGSPGFDSTGAERTLTSICP